VLLLLLVLLLVVGFAFRLVGFLGERSVIHPCFGKTIEASITSDKFGTVGGPWGCS